MADQQEQFSYSDYKVYQRVAKILAETEAEPSVKGKSEPNNDKPESDDPYEANRARLQKLQEQREQKLASITPEQIAEVDKVLDSIRW